MCIAIIQKPGAEIISDSSFAHCWHGNSDGGGMAYVVNGKIRMYKTMKMDDFLTNYKKAKTKYGDKSPFLVHFRFGTEGEKAVINCHPFALSKNLVFAHNGVFSIKAYERYSDTYTMGRHVISPLVKEESIDNPVVQEMLYGYVGTNNKLIFLKSDGSFIVLGEKNGIWDNNSWYSHGGYKSYVVDTTVKSGWGRNRQTNYHSNEECDICEKNVPKYQTIEIDSVRYVAHICYNCLRTIKTPLNKFFATKDWIPSYGT